MNKKAINSRIKEIKKDLFILTYLIGKPKEEEVISRIEEDLGKSFRDEVLPVIHKYDLYIHELNKTTIVWKPKIKTVVKDLEYELDKESEKLSKLSWWKNPPSLLLIILSGLISLVVGIILGIIFTKP